MPLFDDDKLERLRGIANSVFSQYRLPGADRKDAVQKAIVKLERLYQTLEEFHSPFVRKTLKNIAIDILRKGGAVVLPDDLADVADDGDDLSSAALRRSVGKTPPLCVLEARLKLVYAQGHSEPCELIAHAYWHLLGWTPAQIVETLGGFTLGDAAEAFLKRYAQDTRIPPHRLHEVFADLFALNDSTETKVMLSSFWQPASLLEGWVTVIANRVQHELTYDWSEVETEAPNRKLAYLLRRHLKMNYADMIGAHGGDTLEYIAVRFEDEYLNRSGLSRKDVRERFGRMLDYGKAGKRVLNEYYSPARTLTHWINSVHKKLATRLNQQEKLGFRAIFQAAPWPHKYVVFVENFLMKADYGDILRMYSGLVTEEATELLVGRYAARRGKDTATVSGWFAPMNQAGDGFLGDLVERDKKGHESNRDVTARWRGEVFAKSSGLFGCHDLKTVLFAWEAGFLNAVNDREQR